MNALIPVQLKQEVNSMSKSQDRKKDEKKKPLLTAKEKKKEKKSRKNETDVLGN
jgi:hypothetical protein